MEGRTGKTVYLRRSDFERLLDVPLALRDKLIVRLPLKCGLRPYELRHQRREEIDYEARLIYVPPCKRSPRRPVPADPVTLELIKEYGGDEMQGPLIRAAPGYEHRAGPILTKNALRWNVKQIAKAAHIREWRHYYPYLLRHHFAADWALKKGSLETLRRILGHSWLTTTQLYLMRLIYIEDLKGEYDQIKGVTPKMEGNRFYEEYCVNCAHRPVCRFIEQACQASEWATGCEHYVPRQTLPLLKEAQR